MLEDDVTVAEDGQRYPCALDQSLHEHLVTSCVLSSGWNRT